MCAVKASENMVSGESTIDNGDCGKCVKVQLRDGTTDDGEVHTCVGVWYVAQ